MCIECNFLHLDVDECAGGIDNCADEAVCTDTDGSYNCACNTGYTGDGVNCTSKLLHMLYYVLYKLFFVVDT